MTASTPRLRRARRPAQEPALPAELTVGQLAARSGVAVSALHFYETRGLLRSLRTSGNQRRYPREALRRVAVIRAAQQVGLSLAEIGDALATLPDDHAPGVADWRRLSKAWRSHLDERIARLRLLRDQLDGCIGCGCLSLKTCPLRNPGDQAATLGPGASVLEPRLAKHRGSRID